MAAKTLSQVSRIVWPVVAAPSTRPFHSATVKPGALVCAR
jgi:hypothetical protein